MTGPFFIAATLLVQPRPRQLPVLRQSRPVPPALLPLRLKIRTAPFCVGAPRRNQSRNHRLPPLSQRQLLKAQFRLHLRRHLLPEPKSLSASLTTSPLILDLLITPGNQAKSSRSKPRCASLPWPSFRVRTRSSRPARSRTISCEPLISI